MEWNFVTNPDVSKQRRRKKLSLNDIAVQDNFYGTADTSNLLHQMYKGHYDRIQRYKIYDWMDQDSDINRALDIVAEHCTERDEANNFPFIIDWKINDPTEEASNLLTASLSSWIDTNQWTEKNRLFNAVRNVLKYGDWFYFRNPHTFELYSIHPKHVTGAIVDRTNLKILGWVIRNFRFNIEDLELDTDHRMFDNMISNANSNMGTRNNKIVPAIHIVHLTLSEGKLSGGAVTNDPTDYNGNKWPFGESWLENAYSTFRNRDLLEQAYLIHRVQRAPSRLAWYVDVGKQRPDRVQWTLENFKNELNQKRVPQMIGNGINSPESVYNPISQLEDYFIPVTADQRGSKVEQIEGTPWENIPELDYFTKKMMKALRVPYAWLLPSSEGGSVFNDSRAGVAYQEEIEFSRFCTRVQNNIIGDFNDEYKLYNRRRDININVNDYDLAFNPPDNYEDSKTAARDQENINVWAQMKDEPYISKRFAMKRFLKLSDDEILENERMFIEENYPLNADITGAGGGGMGGFGGGLPPMGGDMSIGTGLGDPGMGIGMTDAGMGAGDMGGAIGDGDLMGGGTSIGGLGEGTMKKNNRLLIEKDITSDDLKPVDLKDDGFELQKTRDDKLSLRSDPIKNIKPVIKLMTIQTIRQRYKEKRKEEYKRLLKVNKIYRQPSDMGTGL